MGALTPMAGFVSGYALVLLGLAWAIDRLGARSAVRSARWRTGSFVYHEDHDAWKCHEDQWLWPASFDPDKRVVRYQGQHAICGRCPAKSECSPTPGPREITRQVDPWPHSEAGRFHRGIALVVAGAAAFLVGATLAGVLVGGDPSAIDLVALVSTLVVVLLGGIPLARHLWSTPSGFPESFAVEASSDAPGVPDEETVAEVVDRYATRWSGDPRPGQARS
ncbi:conserved membrane hypothetical protein [Nostocoides japonicum T1-X7]|uniref:Uncharacterized protein n=1 Tax=Nostocoides japonicum T1-X7 TaxID=1194083 RepID=A0A077M259_9MICO|nr:hypothetical protein [Tetrasphaera japonica]CCH80438.1 conserved membrane hypothetical protein [Tetrasphaera japonica T1-X7]